jgi:hypothetical protein
MGVLTSPSALGTRVRCLTLDDVEAYADFRLAMWPCHPAAGDWESVRLKYFHNPLSLSCPGSGLYAYVDEGKILGIMGAYPMPVTLNGGVYPGHMIVDWAVLPAHQFGPVTGTLWNAMMSLPGRKYSSTGTKASQTILERRATKIPAKSVIVHLRPLKALLLRALRLQGYAHPSPLLFDRATLPGGITICLDDNFIAPKPDETSNTAFVPRGRDFWDLYCAARAFNGAIPLNVATGEGNASVVIRLLECGVFRYASLMALDLQPATRSNAATAGTLLRRALLALNVAMVNAVGVDRLPHIMLKAVGRMWSTSGTYWWSIPRPTDTFLAGDVRWWLTNADRDSHWAGNIPFAHT